jgi:hypothetical protein
VHTLSMTNNSCLAAHLCLFKIDWLPAWEAARIDLRAVSSWCSGEKVVADRNRRVLVFSMQYCNPQSSLEEAIAPVPYIPMPMALTLNWNLFRLLSLL